MQITLLKAFGFLKIKYDGENLDSILYRMPIFLSIVVVVFLFTINLSANQHINIFIENSFSSVFTFVQILPGFYIASLAAIASYGNTKLDNRMTGRPPYLEEKVADGQRKSDLSRRRFLTLMFGYLAAISIVLTIFLFFIILGYNASILPVSLFIYNVVYYSLCFAFFFTFFQMILITLHGIYYLADRMHRT